MLLALLWFAAPRIELESVSGVSEDDAQVVLREVGAAAGAHELDLEIQVIGGVTRVLLVLERIASGDVDARAECSAPPGRIEEARTCIRDAVARFLARARPLEVRPTPALVVEDERSSDARIAAYTSIAVSGALAIAGVGLALHASSLHDQLDARPFADDRFRELEQQERSFGISAGVVLGGAVLSLAASLLWAMLE